jgi:tetratricopeptide (TPR) repeat protein
VALPDRSSKTHLSSQSPTRKITLVILGVVLVGTVFLLPQFVTEPWIVGEADDLPVVPESSPSTVSPSTAAELTRYRQESQGVLAKIVAIRDRLLESQVERWQEVEFQQALEMIEAGDEHYSYGDYKLSLEQFRQALSRLSDIETLGQQKLVDAKVEAGAAIESLNLNVASASIELASAIAPQDPQVQKLAARVETLAQLATHIEAGDQALVRDRYQAAQSEYRKAVGLDSSHKRAARSLAQVNKEVTASVFRGHMSRGFAAMENQDYEAARSAFRDAGKIYPGDTGVAKALEQVENRESGIFVSRELERASILTAHEDWEEAVLIYETLLAQDPSLTDARVGLIPAQVRADLDMRLNGFIAEPLSLSSQAEYRAAQTALEDAKGIPNPGPRLVGQIAGLAPLVKAANSPVDIVLRSDNQTHVVLFRVAELGRFEQVSVKLRPGKYVAAGTRSGYRDVRVEFTVTGKPQEEPIVVRCEELIG